MRLALGAGFLLAAGAAHAGSAVVPLASLDGDNGFRLDGASSYDLAGLKMAGAGDVNGDGFDDLVIAAYGAAPNGNYSGSTYVVFGSANGFPAHGDLDALDGSNGFRIDGLAAYDTSGSAVAGGDINGDGFADILIGAKRASDGGRNRAGATYVIFGHAGAFADTFDLATLDGTNGFRIDGGGANEYSGAAIAAGADVNGDGINDIVIGAYGASGGGAGSGGAYVLFGNSGPFAPAIDLATLDGSDGFRADGAAGDYAGRAVSLADVNGDGLQDVVVGAPSSSANTPYAGSAYVMFGSDGVFDASVDLAALDGDSGFRVDGYAPYGSVGNILSTAGDINGDGYDDIAIGAEQSSAGLPYAGSTYVVFGHAGSFAPTLVLDMLDGDNGFRIDGTATYDRNGAAVASAGDVNGDGIDDFITASTGTNGFTGSSYVLFGNTDGFPPLFDLDSLDGSNGFRLDGEAAGDASGRAVGAAGDVNGDGVGDLFVGAPNASYNAASAGSGYVVFGSAQGISDRVFCDGFEGDACAP